jgi:RNA polymerase sigma factor (TIGR02999 family)
VSRRRTGKAAWRHLRRGSCRAGALCFSIRLSLTAEFAKHVPSCRNILFQEMSGLPVSTELTGEIARLLVGARAGEQAAVARLCELLYQDLRRMASYRLRANQPLTLLDTTALVHESFMRLAKLGQVDLADRNHFLGYAARVMRSVIVDHVRAKQTERRGGDYAHVPLDTDVVDSVAAGEDDLIRLNEALDKLARIDPRAVQVVEMRYFADMSDREIAAVLGITERTVGRDWQKARMLLSTVLK